MKKIVTIIVFFCVVGVIGFYIYNQDSSDAPIKETAKYTEEYWYNENVKSRGIVNGEFKEGPWKYYYKYGLLKSKGNFKNNKKKGLWEHYWDLKSAIKQGGISAKINYKDGKKDGLRQKYNIDGELILKQEYVNGMKNGLTEHFDGGKIKWIGYYTNDNKTGKWKFYRENGLIYENEPKYCDYFEYIIADMYDFYYDPEEAYKFLLTIRELIRNKDLQGIFNLVPDDKLPKGFTKTYILSKAFDDIFSEEWVKDFLKEEPLCSKIRGKQSFSSLGYTQIFYDYSEDKKWFIYDIININLDDLESLSGIF